MIENPAKIKVNNGTHVTVDDAIINAADGREYYYISSGDHMGKYIKKEDVN